LKRRGRSTLFIRRLGMKVRCSASEATQLQRAENIPKDFECTRVRRSSRNESLGCLLRIFGAPTTLCVYLIAYGPPHRSRRFWHPLITQLRCDPMKGSNRNAAQTPRYSHKYKWEVKAEILTVSSLVFNPYNNKHLGSGSEPTSNYYHGGE
jgi:hypothetical protein